MSMIRTKITDEHINAVKALAATKEYTRRQIAEKVGISNSTVDRIIAGSSHVGKSHVFSDEIKREAVALVNKGLNTRQVAEKFHTSKTSVAAWCKEARFTTHEEPHSVADTETEPTIVTPAQKACERMTDIIETAREQRAGIKKTIEVKENIQFMTESVRVEFVGAQAIIHLIDGHRYYIAKDLFGMFADELYAIKNKAMLRKIVQKEE